MKLATPPRVIAPRREPVRVVLGTNDPRHRIDLRGRVVLLTGVVAFVVIQLVIHAAVQSGASTVGDPIYAEKLAAIRSHPEFFAEHSGRHRLLAIGSSRTQLCLNAERLTDDRRSVFNFGAAGCGPVAQALYLRRLLAEGLTCDTALVELHPAMLADHNPPFEAPWLHAERLRAGEPEVIREFGWEINTPVQLRAGGQLKATHTHRFALLNAVHPKLLPSPFGFATRSDARGYVPGVEVPPAERLRLLARERQQYAPAFADYRPGGPAVLAVRDMLTQLQAHGIQPILLFSPESSEFRSWYGETGDTAMSRLAEGLAGEFGVPLIQAHGWIPDHQFADGHHATPAGATTFTDRLAVVLREMGR